VVAKAKVDDGRLNVLRDKDRLQADGVRARDVDRVRALASVRVRPSRAADGRRCPVVTEQSPDNTGTQFIVKSLTLDHANQSKN